MKNLVKYAAMCLVIGTASGTAQANSQTRTIAPQTSCFSSCPAVQVKSTRRIVRVEAVPTQKYQAYKATNGKYLAKLTTKDQAYGKILVPVKTTSRTPNFFRPAN